LASEGAAGAWVLVAGGVTSGVGVEAGLGSSLLQPATANAASAARINMRFIVFLFP
jgi:hypothetical protein